MQNLIYFAKQDMPFTTLTFTKCIHTHVDFLHVISSKIVQQIYTAETHLRPLSTVWLNEPILLNNDASQYKY